MLGKMNTLAAVRSPREAALSVANDMMDMAQAAISSALKRRVPETPRRLATRGAARAVLVVTMIVLLFAAFGQGPGGGHEGDDEQGCVQRVKVWSPSRQAFVMRVQNFCE